MLIKNFKALADIEAKTIVKAGSGGVDKATAPANKILGVTTEMATKSTSECDVVLQGITEVRTGGAFALGDLLTTDGSGHAIKAAPSSSTNARIVGIALEASAASGELRNILLQPQQIQG